jgi:hypothetical protein
MRTALLVAAALALCAAPARAQTGPIAWSYPRAADRRDPVVPPQALYSGEGFPELRVHSIAHDPRDPSDSRALVVLTGRSGVRAVVRAGDRLGQYQVLQVHRGCVVAQQNVLGSTRRVVLCLPRPGEAPRP